MRRKILLITVFVLLLVFALAPVMSLSASAEDSAEEAEVETADVQPAATIFSDGFEYGSWPGTWVRGDSNGASGTDTWDLTTYKKASGSKSAFCAGYGYQSVLETIFTESFEYASWPSYWYRGDLDSRNGIDTWDLYSAGYTGSKSAWCAGYGSHTSGKYDDFMQAFMYRTVNLSHYYSVSLRYRYWLRSETNVDYLYVRYHDDSGWHNIDPHSGMHTSWTLSTVNIPRDADAVGFFFYSDYSNVDTGAWVDAVELRGYRYNSAGGVNKYDNNMNAYMYRTVDLNGYSDIALSFQRCISTYNSADRLHVGYRVGATWYKPTAFWGGTGATFSSYTLYGIPSDANAVGFWFESDAANIGEGAYIDNVVLTGTPTKENTVLTLWFTPNPVGPGASVTLSGTLKTAGGSAVYPASVIVEYSTDGGATWKPAWTLATNAAGAFSKSFSAPGTPGNYLVRVRYAGSATYNPSGDTETLTVTAAAQPTIEIWTNKAAYAKGETLTVYIQAFNPGPATTVRATVWFGLPGGGTYLFETYYTGSIPGYYTSPVYTWKTVTIPYSAASGTYSVNAEMRNPSTNALIDSDTYYFTIS